MVILRGITENGNGEFEIYFNNEILATTKSFDNALEIYDSRIFETKRNQKIILKILNDAKMNENLRGVIQVKELVKHVEMLCMYENMFFSDEEVKKALKIYLSRKGIFYKNHRCKERLKQIKGYNFK